jgi:hypothetical protein
MVVEPVERCSQLDRCVFEVEKPVLPPLTRRGARIFDGLRKLVKEKRVQRG